MKLLVGAGLVLLGSLLIAYRRFLARWTEASWEEACGRRIAKAVLPPENASAWLFATMGSIFIGVGCLVALGVV